MQYVLCCVYVCTLVYLNKKCVLLTLFNLQLKHRLFCRFFIRNKNKKHGTVVKCNLPAKTMWFISLSNTHKLLFQGKLFPAQVFSSFVSKLNICCSVYFSPKKKNKEEFSHNSNKSSERIRQTKHTRPLSALY